MFLKLDQTSQFNQFNKESLAHPMQFIEYFENGQNLINLGALDDPIKLDDPV